jgi:nitroreductase
MAEDVGRKDAETDHPIHDLLRRRWSPRAFLEKPIAEGDLLSLLEAARWSPSCINEQPWVYLIARRQDAGPFDEMASCLAESNQVWARRSSLLMIAAAKRTYSRDGKVNPVHLYDLGQSVAHLTVQATALGLYVHQMRGFNLDKTKEVYQVPDDYELASAIAIGYVAAAETLPGNLKDRELLPRQRKPVTEFTFAGRWGHKAL